MTLSLVASNGMCDQSPASLPTYSTALTPGVRRSTLVVVTLVTCMEFLTSYAIGVALPDIQGDLSASSDEGSWILSTYSKCFLIGLVLCNWVAPRVGDPRHRIRAVVLFLPASLHCGLGDARSQVLSL